MSVLRKILGILVMIAGILGLVISIAGLVGAWMYIPSAATYVISTLDTLDNSVTVSQSVMQTTGEALGATVTSVDALSTMLSASASSIGDTAPVLRQVQTFMEDDLPTSLGSATAAIRTAQEAAGVLESTMQQLNTFQMLLSATPLLGDLLGGATLPLYAPEVPLADSLGEMAISLEGLPDTLAEVSANLDTADDNLAVVESSLTTMADSVKVISSSLTEYKVMVVESRSSMDNLRPILSGLEDNLPRILNYISIALTAILLWLLAAQIVILSQGWELFKGTAGRMEG
jgi:hypothetical protein